MSDASRVLDRDLGQRRFGRVNWLGTWTLLRREVARFMNVWTQTIGAPLITAGLFIMIFTIAVGPDRGPVMGVPFLTFIAPGILTMTVIQNAFANTSSSIAGAKIQGNIVDTLMPPLSAGELVAGYLAGAVARGRGSADRGAHHDPLHAVLHNVQGVLLPRQEVQLEEGDRSRHRLPWHLHP